MRNLYLLTIISIIALTFAQTPQDDLVNTTDLFYPIQYSFDMYSGYLNTSDAKKKIHYWFFPSQSNPDTDPVLLWLNGGPGCSSLLGATSENGPFYFDVNSSNFVLNNYSWNLKANVLYLESPADVGYSVSDSDVFNDNTTAQYNLEALVSFFTKFSNYTKNEFYISGESYAGIYVPTLSYWVHQYNQNSSSSPKINFKGFAVGNGCTHPIECELNAPYEPFVMDIYRDFYFVSEEISSTYRQACLFENYNNPSQQCQNAYQVIYNMAAGLNQYDLFGICFNFSGPSKTSFHRNLKQSDGLLGDSGVPPCADAYGAVTFFNNDTVKQRLHIDPSVINNTWYMCQPNLNYTSFNTGSYYLYPELIAAGYRIWIYSGDSDGSVPITGTIYWLNQLKQQLQLQDFVSWRPWFTDSTYPGVRYNAGQFWSTDKFTFVSFKGCGHMVPQFNRLGSLDMINAFLLGDLLPEN